MIFIAGVGDALAYPNIGVLLLVVSTVAVPGLGIANTLRAIIFVSFSFLRAMAQTSPKVFKPPRPRRTLSRVRYHSGPVRIYAHALRLARVEKVRPQIPRGE